MLLSTDKLDFYKKEFMSYIMTHEASGVSRGGRGGATAPPVF